MEQGTSSTQSPPFLRLISPAPPFIVSSPTSKPHRLIQSPQGLNRVVPLTLLYLLHHRLPTLPFRLSDHIPLRIPPPLPPPLDRHSHENIICSYRPRVDCRLHGIIWSKPQLQAGVGVGLRKLRTCQCCWTRRAGGAQTVTSASSPPIVVTALSVFLIAAGCSMQMKRRLGMESHGLD